MLQRLVPSALFVVLLVTLSVLPATAFAQADPVALFRQAIDARNRGDLNGTMAVFAPDAVRQDGSCQPPCIGEAAIRRSMQQNIEERLQATILSAGASGNTVTARTELRSDVIRSRGVERIISIYKVDFRDDKVVLWSSTLDATDQQTAAYRAATAQATPAVQVQLPRTGDAADPRLTALLGLAALLAGRSLRRLRVNKA